MRIDRRPILFGWLLLSVLLLNGCQATKRPAAKSDDPVATESERVLEKRSQAHAHYAAGVLHDLNDQTDLALEEFFKAAQSDPDDETLILEVSRRLAQNKQPDKALELLLPTAARSDASGAVFARLGLIYSQLGQIDKAIEANRMAVKRQPRVFSGYQNLFLNYLQSKQPAKALELLEEAAKVTDPGVDFLLGLGELFVNYTIQFPIQRETVRFQGLAVLNRVAALSLRSAHARFRLAECYNSLGDSENAAKAYLAMLKNPGDLPLLRDTARARLAQIYLRTNDRKGAIQQLEEVVREDPANGLGYYFLGTIAYDEKRLKEAVEYLRKALLFGGQFEAARLEQIHYDLALAQIGLDETAGAVATIAAARKKFGSTFVSEYLSGIAENSQKNYAAAVKHFTEAEIIARAKDPTRLDYRFYFQAGAAAAHAGDRPQATILFEKYLALAPDAEQAYYDLALAQVSLEDVPGALATLAKAREKFPAGFMTEFVSGMVESGRKNFAAALKYFTEAEAKARTADPKRLDFRFYFQIGAAAERTGDRALAQNYFEKCLELSPDFSPALNYLGYMWAERGENLPKARDLIERALKGEPDSAAYLDSLGWVLYKQNQPQEALDYILKAVKLNEEPDATLYDHLGDIYAALKQMDKAREAWTKSVGIEKNDTVQKKLDAAAAQKTSEPAN